jgi:GNAT superfamily N-acetyltransferase
VERDGRIIAVLIAKRGEEQKLCCLWVDPMFRGSGVGVRLIKEGMDWVGTSVPLATVPEERMPEFSDILERLGFALTEVVESYYRPGKKEFVFNGRLSRVVG